MDYCVLTDKASPYPGRMIYHVCGRNVSCIFVVVANETFGIGIAVTRMKSVKLHRIVTPLPRVACGDTYQLEVGRRKDGRKVLPL